MCITIVSCFQGSGEEEEEEEGVEGGEERGEGGKDDDVESDEEAKEVGEDSDQTGVVSLEQLEQTRLYKSWLEAEETDTSDEEVSSVVLRKNMNNHLYRAPQCT